MRTVSGRRALRFLTFGGLLMPFLFLAPGTPSAPHVGATGDDGAVRCTMAMSYGPYLMNSLEYILATPTAEVISVPTALQALGRRPAPNFDPEGEPVQGQIVELHGALAADAEGVAALLEGHERAVVVWWAYDTACRPYIPADHSRIFAEPEIENVIAGVLKDREHWVDGVPLIHVYQTLQTPLPGLRKRMLDRRAADTGIPASDFLQDVLSASELWSLMSGLSFAEGAIAIRADDPVDPATEAVILDWARSHPDRWTTYPAYRQVVRARSARQARFATGEPPPIEGVYRSRVRVGDYEGDLCFWLTPVPADPARWAQELPADYDDYSPPPWEEAPPAATGFRLQAEAACPPEDRLTAPLPPELQPWERLRAVSFWLRTDTELEARPGELRAWQAALRPQDFQFALESTGAPAPDGVNPRGRVQYQPSAQALVRPPSDEELRLVTELVTTARVALLEDGRVTIEESRGPEPITFAVTAERLLPE